MSRFEELLRRLTKQGFIAQNYLLSLFRRLGMTVERVVVVVLLFYVHGKHLRSCRDGQLT